MKLIILISLVLIPLALESAETPSRWGGLFGFGTSKQKGDQISADLFPAGTAGATQGNSSTPPAVASPVTGSTAIFRSGEPLPVEPVSYVIENGQKVEKKKSSIFAFGKRGDAAPPENQVLAPVPAPPAAVPIQASPIVSAPVPLPVPAPTQPAQAIVATPASAPPMTSPAIEEPKEQRFGWIPFLSRKKDDAPIPAVANPVVVQTATPVASEIAPSGTSTTAVPAANETAKPIAATTAPDTGSFEVPKKEETKAEKPKSEGGGLLSPIANLRPPRKPIDLTNAETIIQNGEIVASSESTFESAPANSSPSERRPPAVVNGVKTYSSWDDVGAQSTSAADRIINQIR